jgi:hypothetical protein
MEEFDHFLITRFNLKSRDWITDKNKAPILTDDWLEHRLALFDAYCLPSVTAQTTKNFSWLIYFSEDTQSSVKEHVSKTTFMHPWIHIFYIRDQEEFVDRFHSDIQQRRTPLREFLITTRIDNDDVIHPRMIEIVQGNFQSQIFMAVNFALLLCFAIEGKHKLFRDI